MVETQTLHLVEFKAMPLSSGALEQKIDDVARDADAAHIRNHERFDDLRRRVDTMEATVKEHGTRILEQDHRLTEEGSRITNQGRRWDDDQQAQKDRKIEATQVRFTTQQVIAIAAGCGALVAGPWFFNRDLRADVASILSRQSAQQIVVDKIQEQQTKDIDELKRDGKLHTIQINNLREEIISLKSKGAR